MTPAGASTSLTSRINGMATLTQHTVVGVFKKNLNASKPSEHPPSGGKMSKGLGGNIGCKDKTSS